jgi:hypothetical protein
VVTFEVELAPSLIEYLQAERVADADRMHQVVWDLSYAGDEGGIMCHMSRSEETGRVVEKREAALHPVARTDARTPRLLAACAYRAS